MWVGTKPYVAFFALKTIDKGDELAYNYVSQNEYYPWRNELLKELESKNTDELTVEAVLETSETS